MTDPDWKIKMDAARKKAIDDANTKTDGDLNAITDQANMLSKTFKDLELTDAQTYKDLQKIVQDATDHNVAIANVIDRAKQLGEAGKGLLQVVQGLSGASGLNMLKSALKI